jgi:hypothetical protein
MALGPDLPIGINLSIAAASGIGSWSLGFAIGQIYNPLTRGAVDVGTVLSGTVRR